LFLTFKKWTALYIVCLVLLFACFAAILWQGRVLQTAETFSSTQSREVPTLIIDPGHGGEDGGAISADGTVESGLNLEISLCLEEEANLLGWDTVMTRREDVSIHDPNCQTLRQKKVSDLKNRVALCNQTENGVLISIHQNSLPASKSVRGAQVFYNHIPGSEELAKAIQEQLNLTVNRDHPKSSKPISSQVYLLNNVTCPAVIVECGFLSNSEDTALLKTPLYQQKLATVILSAVTRHLTLENICSIITKN